MVGHGYDIPVSGPNAVPDAISAIARGGEDLGFTHAYTSDHIVVPTSFDSIYPYTADGSAPFGTSFLELLTTITYMAAVTSKVRLVTSVMVVPYRAPMHTAKVLSTIDVLSQGRLTVGVGVGWMREEFEAVDAPPFEARGRVTDEYLRAFKELWSADKPNADGDFVKFSDVAFEPKPVQSPLPIWIGGESVPALRRAATLGDGWYPISFGAANPLDTLDRFTASLDKLHALAKEAGRDPSEIEITYHAGAYGREAETVEGGERKAFTGSDGQVADDIKRFEEAGVSNIFWLFPGDTPQKLLASMERFATGVARG
jgi:probable F420-dependent oxidoreductase